MICRTPDQGGFTFIELLLGILLLSGILLTFLWVNSASTRGAMDNYYETLCIQLAREPIEVLSAFGYEWLVKNHEGINQGDPQFPYGGDAFRDLAQTTERGVFPRQWYPAEVVHFQRRVRVKWVEREDGGGHGAFGAFVVETTVRPRTGNPLASLLSQDELTLRGTVMGRE